MYSYKNIDNENTKRLLSINDKFFETVKPYIIAEVLVGSLAWGPKTAVHTKSDIDIVLIYDSSQLPFLLQTKYLLGHFRLDVVKDVLTSKSSDYLVAKIFIDDKELSIDIIDAQFFSFMCMMDLQATDKSYSSRKYGQDPQLNSYIISNFKGVRQKVDKCSPAHSRGGYFIELPLYHIINNEDGLGEYFYGIPTVKLLTPFIFFDSNNFASQNLLALQSNILKRMKYEYTLRSIEEKYNMLNLFVFADRMDNNIKAKYDINPINIDTKNCYEQN